MSCAPGTGDLYAIFERALSQPRARRSAFLAQACQGRSSLQRRIERLLVLSETGDGFLERSPLRPLINIPDDDGRDSSRRIIGAYRLLRSLGAGGMAEVWLAERSEGGFQQRAAIKIIRDAPDAVGERLAAECGILASLVHPGIARLYDGRVEDDGTAYMVMEYVEGRYFIAYCNEHRLCLADRLALFLQICDAVAYAHTQLVVHRDLKPTNILVTADGTVKLLDFGIAKVIDPDGSKEITKTVHMSPAYAAPEQLTGDSVGTATDVYALGVILFELLTDALPWSGGSSSLATAVKRLLDAPPPRPSRLAGRGSPIAKRAIRGDLDAIVGMALRREPRARYPDARALADEIRKHIDHKAVAARAGARTYVLRRFLRRHWIGLSAATVLFVAMACAIVAISWEERKAIAEAKRAESVQSFMIDVFRTNRSQQSDPVKARQTTARELLDMGAERVEKGLPDAPFEKLSLLRVFADLYNDLALAPDELRLRRQAVHLSRIINRSDSEELAADLLALAGAMHGSEASDEAASTLAQAKTILDRRNDSTSKLRGRLLLKLAEALQGSNIPRARASAEESVKVLSPYGESSDLADAFYMLGLTTSYSGRPMEAVPSLQRAIDISGKVDGVPNPKLPVYYYQLAECELASGHRPEALSLLNQAAAIETHYLSWAARYRTPLENLRGDLLEPSARGKPGQEPSASYNKALTIAQSRSTVRSVTPKASAVSDSEKPAK